MAKSNRLAEPRDEKCYSSKENGLQGMASKQSRFPEARKSAAHTVKKRNAILGVFGA